MSALALLWIGELPILRKKQQLRTNTKKARAGTPLEQTATPLTTPGVQGTENHKKSSNLFPDSVAVPLPEKRFEGFFVSGPFGSRDTASHSCLPHTLVLCAHCPCLKHLAPCPIYHLAS